MHGDKSVAITIYYHHISGIHIYRKCSETILFPFFKHQKTIDGYRYIRCNMILFQFCKDKDPDIYVTSEIVTNRNEGVNLTNCLLLSLILVLIFPNESNYHFLQLFRGTVSEKYLCGFIIHLWTIPSYFLLRYALCDR